MRFYHPNIPGINFPVRQCSCLDEVPQPRAREGINLIVQHARHRFTRSSEPVMGGDHQWNPYNSRARGPRWRTSCRSPGTCAAWAWCPAACPTYGVVGGLSARGTAWRKDRCKIAGDPVEAAARTSRTSLRPAQAWPRGSSSSRALAPAGWLPCRTVHRFLSCSPLVVCPFQSRIPCFAARLRRLFSNCLRGKRPMP